MEKCHLTYSFIFTPRVPHLLTSWGLDLISEPDKNGTQNHDLWLTSAHGPFCCRFIEIIDERSLTVGDPQDKHPLKPGFSQNPPPFPTDLSPRFALEGFVMENKTLSPEDPLISMLPAPVFFENRETSLMRQLGYRKISPYWALLVRPSDPKSLQNAPEPVTEAIWRDHPVQWLQLETSSWDILITN